MDTDILLREFYYNEDTLLENRNNCLTSFSTENEGNGKKL